MDGGTARVGLIGLGTIGSPMAHRILGGGFSLTVHDVRPEPVEALAAAGASTAASAREVAESCDIVLTSLPTVQAWRDVYFGDSGLVAGARPGLTFVETSTLTPARVKEVAAAVLEDGAAVVDAPLLVRTSYHPDTSHLQTSADFVLHGLVMVPVGGEDADVARVTPVLQTFGDPIWHLGPLGAGSMVKVLNNATSHAYFVVALEVLAVAASAGMDLRKLEQILRHTSARSAALNNILANYMEHGQGGMVMNIGAGIKDSESMLEVAADLGVPMLMQNVNHAYYQMAAGLGASKDAPWDTQMMKLFEGFINQPLRFNSAPAAP